MSTYRPADPENDFEAILDSARESPSGLRLLGVCLGAARFLIEKNKAYGDSALKPMRIFSKADAVEQIRVRIDDKLSRLGRGQLAGEDAELDMLGYLVLLFAARAND